MTTRVLIADDHPTFRRGLKALFDSLKEMRGLTSPATKSD